MKTKSAAKGNPKLGKEHRYALTLFCSERILKEIIDKTLKFPLPYYFDKRFSIGQVLDDIQKLMSLKSVLDFENVQQTQLYLAIEDDNKYVKVNTDVKLGEIGKTIEGFE